MSEEAKRTINLVVGIILVLILVVMLWSWNNAMMDQCEMRGGIVLTGPFNTYRGCYP